MSGCAGCSSCGSGDITLAIDIGNSSITIGLLRCGQIFYKTIVATKSANRDFKKTIDFIKRRAAFGFSAAVISVVPNLDKKIKSDLKKFGIKTKFLACKDINVKIKCEDPKSVGMDRIVNAYAVHQIYKEPAIVVDCGTATTFDIVSAKGEYLGGAIAPGMQMGMQALAEKCAKLGLFEIDIPKSIIGKNTKEALQSGVVFGQIAMITGMVERMKSELKFNPKIIGTGGFINFISKGTIIFDDVDPDLTLKGIGLARH